MSATDSITLNGATNQIERHMAALSDLYVSPDERSFAELLAFAVEFGRLIVFYDLDDRADGDWSLFFAADPTFALACISVVDVARIERDFDLLVTETRAAHLFERKFKAFCRVFDSIERLAAMFNRWLSWPMATDDSPIARRLQHGLVTAVRQGMSRSLHDLAAMAKGAGEPRALGREVPLDLAGFSALWDLGTHICPDSSAYRGGSLGRRIDSALDVLSGIFGIFADALITLRNFSAEQLGPSMLSANHAPQAALYIAFAGIFAEAQAAMDNFSGRLTRFYYGEVLREVVRAEEADRLFLTFTQAATPGLGMVVVPANSIFPAGTDSDGQSISYSNEMAVEVTTAAIAKVLTLRMTSAPLFETIASPPIPSPSMAPAQVLLTEVAVPTKPSPVSWSTFGCAQIGSAGIETTEPATLGFAIASPTLQLTGGQRTIDLTMSFSGASLDAVKTLLQQLADQTGLSSGQLLCEILGGGFRLFLSAAGGWLAVDSYSVVTGSVDDTFTFSIVLPLGAVAVVAAGTPLPKGEKPPAGIPPGPASPDPANPVMTAYLIQDRILIGASGAPVEVFPYAILSSLQLTSLSVGVSVAGLAGATLSNSTGLVDGGKPFLPFGAPPVLGAGLVIQQPELFIKVVDQLTLNVVWFNLPQTNEGFLTYYNDYTLGPDGTPVPDLFNNQSFMVDIAVDQPGYWTLAGHVGSPPGLSHFLFRTSDGDPVPVAAAPLLPGTEFSDLEPVDVDPPAYYNPADSSLRVVLSAPPYAFGDQLYARNVMAAVVADLPDPVRSQETCRARCAAMHQSLTDGGQVVDAAADASTGASEGTYHASLNAVVGTTLEKLTGLAHGAIGDAINAVEAAGNSGMALLLRQSLESLLEQAAKDGNGWFGRILGRFKNDTPAATQGLIGKLEDWIATNGDAFGRTGTTHLDNGRMLLKTAGAIGETHAAAAGAPVPAARMLTKVGLAAAKTALSQPVVTSMEACLAQQTGPTAPVQYPNQPWQPQMASITIDYHATTTLPAVDQSTRFYHLTPFGGYEAMPWPEQQSVGLLPASTESGAFLLGLSGVSLPLSLTLLIQMDSGVGDWSDHSPAVVWRLLGGNAWAELSLQSDGTNGLQNSGIIAFALPAPSQGSVSTQLSPDYTWISASVAQDPDQFPRTASVVTNAVDADWIGPGGASNLGLVPLSAGTIKSITPPLDGVSTVAQPLASFGGRPRLSGEALYPWLGERLRHKNRAVQSWDYVRLVLAEFPFVWQCEALTARSSAGGGVPGSVLVVVVPGPSTPDIADPTAPVASSLQLSEVGGYLKALASPFTTIEVSNPAYVRITVTADVVFMDGGTPQRLNTDLIGYLSPWYYDVARAAEGGRYVSEDAIAAFIRNRPYVAAILTISYGYSPDRADLQWYYMTSALEHHIVAASPS